MAKFSFVVPVYNVEKYLQRCLNSLLNQKFKDFEIILVDDGSTDGCSKICDSFISNSVHVFHKNNGGLSSARNLGIKKAQGEYIIFVDSDDWISLNMLEEINKIVCIKQYDFIKFGVFRINNNKIVNIKTPSFDSGEYLCDDIRKKIAPGIVGQPKLLDYSRTALLSAYSYAFKRKFLIKNNLEFKSERKILNEDKEFNFRTIFFADSIYILKKPLYYYDTREGSLTQKYITNMFAKKTLLLEYEKNFLEQRNLFLQFYRFYFNNCIDNIYECILNECTHNCNKRNAIKNISMILKSSLCKEAINKCYKKGCSIKAKIILFLLKHKQSHIFYLLYNFFH